MAIFSNQATLTYNGNTTSSNIAYGEILDLLAVSKTAIDGTYTQGDRITYVVTVRNTGSTPVANITLTDNLGETAFGTGTVVPLTPEAGSVRVFVDGVLDATPTVTAGPPLTVTGINIPAGGDAVIIYSVLVNGFANPTAGSSVTNTATISGGGLTAPITAEATVTSLAEPRLTITKSITPTQVVDNDRVTYTFVIQNTGNTAVTVADNTTVTDTFDPILTNLTATLDGAPFTAYTYNEATGLFATTGGAITVPAATVVQNPDTGVYTLTPGTTTLTVTGTI